MGQYSTIEMLGELVDGEFEVLFLDWNSGEIVRRIDVEEKKVSFSAIPLCLHVQSNSTFFLSRVSCLVPVR